MDLTPNWNHISNLIQSILNFVSDNSQYCLFLIIILIVWHYFGDWFGFTNKVVDLNSTKLVERIETSDKRPHYPNGWIPIIESNEIGINQIKSLVAFGRNLIVFRGQSGTACVLDAFCPHLGAHLGVGGKVIELFGHDCIRCPFHGWTFRGKDGLCVAIPSMTASELPKAQIKTWNCFETNGYIFVWYHSEELKPNWFPPDINEIKTKTWNFEGRTEHHVDCYFQDIPENGPDRAHLEELHSPAVMAGNVLSYNMLSVFLSHLLRHDWASSWAPSATEHHIAHMDLKVKNILLGLCLLEIDFKVTQTGPAFVELRYKCNALGGIAGTFIQMVTPLKPYHNRIVHHFYAEPTLKSKLLSKFLLYGELRMIERDIIIWNNKRFIDNPIFSKNEKSLVSFRRWFKQFYAETNLKK